MSKHIQITGYARSGTTLLFAMLNSTAGNYKVDNNEFTATKYLQGKNTIGKRPLDLMDHMNIIKSFEKVSKELHWLLITRDIRSIITSIHDNIPNDYFIGYLDCYRVSGFNQGDKTAPGIVHLKSMKDSLRECGNGIEINYEDLILKPDKIQKKIFDHFSISYNGKFSEHYKNKLPEFFRYGKADGPIHKESLYKWKLPEHRERIITQFRNHPQLFNILIEDGYEDNNNWFNEFLNK